MPKIDDLIGKSHSVVTLAPSTDGATLVSWLPNDEADAGKFHPEELLTSILTTNDGAEAEGSPLFESFLSDLEELIPDQAKEALQLVALRRLDLGRYPRGNFATINLEFPGQWDILPGVLALRDPSFVLSLRGGAGNRELGGKLVGSVLFGGPDGAELDLFLDFSSLTMDAFLVPISNVSGHGPAGLLQLDNAGFDEVSCSSILLYASVRDREMSLELNLDAGWTAGPLTLEKVKLFASYAGGVNSSVAAGVQAQVLIDGATLDLWAVYRGKGAGWTFSGNVKPARPLPAGKLLASALKESADVTIPDVISSFAVNSLGLVFNTSTRALDFNFGLDFGVGQLFVDTKVMRVDKLYEKVFTGRLVLNAGGSERIFEILYANRTSTFVARYESAGGETIGLKEIVGALDSAAGALVPSALSCTLKSASAAYDGKNKKWIFSASIGDIDFSSLSGLPLLGSAFSQSGGIKLSLRPVFGSPGFDANSWNEVKGQFDGVDALPNAPSVLATLDIGGQKTALNAMRFADQSAAGVVAPLPNAPATQQQKPLGVTLGPLVVDQIHFGFNDGKVGVAVDGSFGFSGLRLVFLGLKAEGKLDEIRSGQFPDFSIEGLGLSLNRGALAIEGVFLATSNGFGGKAMVRMGALTIVGMGAFSELDGSPSMFLFALIKYPLGGPAFFFVEGLAFGFGVNRRFIPPPIEAINTFPLVAQAMSPPGSPEPDPRAEFLLLSEYLQPAVGEYFVSVGIKFSSFELIHSFALVTVAFGDQLEFSLLGASEFVVPPPPAVAPPLVRISLALRAVVAKGLIDVSGQLTKDSYVYSPMCVPTGGFVFRSWIDGEHKGDSMLTVGGYHPSYRPPQHYPAQGTVPRLGYAWFVDSSTFIKGSLYFALTPRCIMAGASLEALWQSDSMDAGAHFSAGVDFLICWKPLHYEASLYLSIGGHISFLDFDLGADIRIWGPEFGGSAHIHVGVLFISFDFDVNWGSEYSNPPDIEWTEFRKSFLPEKPESLAAINVASGLVKMVDKLAIVNPKEFGISVSSLIPIGDVKGVGNSPLMNEPQIEAFGVAPMGEFNATSTLTLTVTRGGSDATADFRIHREAKLFPYAIWGTSQARDTGVKNHINAIGDVRLVPAETHTAGESGMVLRGALAFDSIDKEVREAKAITPYGAGDMVAALDTANTIRALATTITDQIAVDMRECWYQSVGGVYDWHYAVSGPVWWAMTASYGMWGDDPADPDPDPRPPGATPVNYGEFPWQMKEGDHLFGAGLQFQMNYSWDGCCKASAADDLNQIAILLDRWGKAPGGLTSENRAEITRRLALIKKSHRYTAKTSSAIDRAIVVWDQAQKTVKVDESLFDKAGTTLKALGISPHVMEFRHLILNDWLDDPVIPLLTPEQKKAA